jgi:hypothetical protein
MWSPSSSTSGTRRSRRRTPVADDVPGIRTVALRKPGDKVARTFIHIDLKKAFEENPKRPPVKLGRLAAALLWLNPIEVFDAITKNNERAAKSLFRIALGKEPPATMDDAAHSALRIEAVKIENGRTDPRCVDFELRGDELGDIVLPENPAFSKFLKSPELDGRRAKLVRFKVIQPDLDKLTGPGGELADIRAKAQQCRSAIDDIAKHVGERLHVFSPHAAMSQDAGALGDVGILWMLEGMLGAIVNNPKDPSKKGSSDERKLEDLRAKVIDLRQKATKHLVQEPLTGTKLLENLKAKGDALKAAVEAESFVKHIDVLVANQDLLQADPIWMDVSDALVAAITVLAGTDHVDAVRQDHVEPLIEQLASTVQLDFTNVVLDKKPLFLKALKEKGAPPQVSRPSAFLRYGAAPSSVIGAIVGNTAGPSSLVLAIKQTWMSHVMKAHFKQCVINGSFDNMASISAKTFKSFIKIVNEKATLSADEIRALTKGINEDDFSAFHKFAWGRKAMSSWHWGAALGVLSLLAFYTSVMNADLSSPEAMINAITSVGGSITSSFVNFAQVLKTFPTFGKEMTAFGKFFNKELKMFEFGKNFAAKAGLQGAAVTMADLMGAIGGVFMMIGGYETYRESRNANDTTGMYIGIGSAIAGGFSVLGFLCALGLLGATGVGAPLMIVGAVIGAIVGLIAIARDIATPGSLLVFKAFLDYFDRDARPSSIPGVQLPPSTFKLATGSQVPDSPAKAELLRAFVLVQEQSHPKVPPFNIFYAADKKVALGLFQLGFDIDQISKICDEEFTTIAKIIDADNESKLIGTMHASVFAKTNPPLLLNGGTVTLTTEDGKNSIAQTKVVLNRARIDLPQNSYRCRIEIDGMSATVANIGIIAQKTKSLEIEVE